MTVDVSAFELPLETPLSTARGDISTRTGFVVRGRPPQEGVGEATPLPGWTESEDECRRALETVESLGGALSSTTLDDTPAARHAVALALFDARARERAESLARFLAGPHTPVADTVPVNATVGDGSVEETVMAVDRAVEAGYDCVKVKVGVASVERDVDRLVAVADHTPVTLRADANGSWTVDEARTFLTGLENGGVDLDYVEQPVGEDQIEELATLREESPVRVAADESLAATSVDAVLAAEAADVLVLKPMAMGGPAQTLAAASRAAEIGVESVVTTTIDGVVARTAALHVAAALGEPPACGLATGDLLTRDLAPDPAPVVDGTMAVPDGPGLAGDALASDRLDVEWG